MTPSTVRFKRLAEAATPGPWFLSMSNQVVRTLDPEPKAIAKFVEDDMPNAQFISAANPEAVLGLIARIEKLEAALQFYADPRTYEGGHNDDVGSTGIDIDYRGNTAREALKEET